MIARFVFMALVAWILQPIVGECSQFVYMPCGEETPEFNRVLPKLSNPATYREGIGEMVKLAQSGDYCSFIMVSEFLKRNADLHEKFVSQTRCDLISTRKFDTLAKIGKDYLDKSDPRTAAIFIRPAYENIDQVTVSREDVEYNYGLSLCTQKTPLKTDKFDPYSECWKIVQKYLERKDQLFDALMINFFISLKNNGQDKLINDVGHFILEKRASTSHAVSFFITTFEGTPHWDRLMRQMNAIVVDRFSTKHLAQAVKEKEDRARAYIERTSAQVAQYAVQEILTLLADHSDVKRQFAQYAVKTAAELSKDQQRHFARYLLDQFNERIFAPQNIDVAEFLQNVNRPESLFAKSERLEFLLTTVFPKFKEAAIQSIADKAQQVVYNRLAIMLRDEKPLATQISQVMAQATENEDKLIASLTDLVAQNNQYMHALFADIPSAQTNTFEQFLKSLGDNQKRAIVYTAFKRFVAGE